MERIRQRATIFSVDSSRQTGASFSTTTMKKLFLIKSFPDLNDQEPFCQPIPTVPSQVCIRVILIESPGSNPGYGQKDPHWRWSRMLPVSVVDALGTTYEIDLVFLS